MALFERNSRRRGKCSNEFDFGVENKILRWNKNVSNRVCHLLSLPPLPLTLEKVLRIALIRSQLVHVPSCDVNIQENQRQVKFLGKIILYARDGRVSPENLKSIPRRRQMKTGWNSLLGYSVRSSTFTR